MSWSEQRGLSVFSQDCQKPNGVTLSPRGNLVYVSDTADRSVRVYEINVKGIQLGRVFTKTSQSNGPDGVKTDAMGNVWVWRKRA